MIRARSVLAFLATVLAFTFVGTTAAEAAPAHPAAGAALYRVQNLDKLSPQEQARARQELLVVREEETVSTSPANAAAARADRIEPGDVSAMVTGCWYVRYTRRAYAAAGNTLYTYYTVGRWCSSGSTVTSATLLDRGGETSTPGWRYEGAIRTGQGIVSNQARIYSQHRFVLGVGGWDVQSPTPCARIRGTASSTYYGDGTCGIY